MLKFCIIACVLVRATVGVEDREFFMNQAQEELQRALNVRLNTGVAKNVIFMMGDGMGISTITAARIYKGQKAGLRGEEFKLNFEQLPHAAFSKTYAADRQTSASASTAVAMVGGVKVNFGTVGFDARVLRRNCSLVNDPSVRVDTILDWSLAEGKSVGIITTARVTHASPSAVYAHTPDRNWEKDNQVPDPACPKDIAAQLIEDNPNINVILGGGRRNFYNRLDGKNLTSDWEAYQAAQGRDARYITTASQLRDLNPDDVDFLLGLFAESHMAYELARNPADEPSISEMTEKAIQILSKNPKGFFLFVEGAKIDIAHHDNYAKRALEDAAALDDAVGMVRNIIGDDTLLIVTADHSHPFNMVGYPARGNPILGLVNPVDPGQEATDGLPYSTLDYANGPGPGRSLDLSTVDTAADDFQFPRMVPLDEGWETHAGEDVGIFAEGPMAHLFHGVHEQNYIAHVMGYASCVGPNKDHCSKKRSDAES